LFFINQHFIDVSKASDLEQSKFAPVGAPLPGVHVLIMDNEYNVKSIGISGEVKLYFIRFSLILLSTRRQIETA